MGELSACVCVCALGCVRVAHQRHMELYGKIRIFMWKFAHANWRASDIAKESAAAGPTGKSYAGANIVWFLFVAFGCLCASAERGIFHLMDPAGKNGVVRVRI